MFARNPFLSASEQYLDAALTRFGDVRCALHQVTDGEIQVVCGLHLAPPPSELGVLEASFVFDQGAAQRLLGARELAADDDLNAAAAAGRLPELERRAELLITRRFTVPAGSAEHAQELADAFAAIVDGVELYGGQDADGWVDVQARRSPRAARYGAEGRVFSVSAGFEEVLSARDVHARDWQRAAGVDHELACELSAAVHGQRPPLDSLRAF